MTTHILHLEDENELRKYAKLVLLEAGYKYSGAVSGLDALQQLETLKPDLIICDYQMPVMNGDQFIKLLREKDKNTPIIANSSVYNHELLKAGATDYSIYKMISHTTIEYWNELIFNILNK